MIKWALHHTWNIFDKQVPSFSEAEHKKMWGIVLTETRLAVDWDKPLHLEFEIILDPIWKLGNWNFGLVLWAGDDSGLRIRLESG